MRAPIPALQQVAVETPFVGAEAPAGEGHSPAGAALPTSPPHRGSCRVFYEENYCSCGVDGTVYVPRHQEVCLRCGHDTMVWATSSWHCTRCGFHEGCCGS